MAADMDPVSGKSFRFKRGLDELIAMSKKILQDFHKMSVKIIGFITNITHPLLH
jgi:hypothetical protein